MTESTSTPISWAFLDNATVSSVLMHPVPAYTGTRPFTSSTKISHHPDFFLGGHDVKLAVGAQAEHRVHSRVDLPVDLSAELRLVDAAILIAWQSALPR